MTDDISIHVFKGVKLMGIYGENDILDKDMARERNKEIELKVENLRELLNFNGTKLRPERVEEINEEIRKLLTERDDNTFKYGLAGKAFERFHFKKTDTSDDGADRDGDFTFSNGTRITRKAMVPEVGQEDMSEDTLYDKLISSGIPMSVIEEKTEVTGDSRFRFITEEMVTLYSKKNTDYGDAFAQSLDEDGLLVSRIRLKDKLNRFAKLIENDALVNDESMRDTLIDMANYAVMTMMWLDENE